MEHKSDRKKIVRYWQQLRGVEGSMWQHESMQEEKETAMQKKVEWKAGKDFLLFKKDEIAALHTQHQRKVNICVFTETQTTCLNLYLKQCWL